MNNANETRAEFNHLIAVAKNKIGYEVMRLRLSQS